LPDLNSEFLFELRIPQKKDAMIDMGQTPLSELMFSVADSGSFAGPKKPNQVEGLRNSGTISVSEGTFGILS